MMTLSTFIISTAFILSMVYGDRIIRKALAALTRHFKSQLEVIPEPYDIEYPTEPMMPNYEDIMNEIDLCIDEKSLKIAYVRIAIFQGNYPDSEKFTKELVTAYRDKEIEVKAFIKDFKL